MLQERKAQLKEAHQRELQQLTYDHQRAVDKLQQELKDKVGANRHGNANCLCVSCVLY